MMHRATVWTAFVGLVLAGVVIGLQATPAWGQAPARKPNILVIFGDDVGQSNISAYTHGLVGYKTPHIDRMAKEGMMFTDYYAENSCTAGRSTFITGQAVLRTGLQGRRPGGHGRAPEGRHHHRPGPQAARLRHRPVRQEPPGRPGRIPAHCPWLRRVLR